MTQLVYYFFLGFHSFTDALMRLQTQIFSVSKHRMLYSEECVNNNNKKTGLNVFSFLHFILAVCRIYKDAQDFRILNNACRCQNKPQNQLKL